ncbi:hypothetical protein [Pantoea agglomerans]|uniref:hypothetical protein n=1 Tax=Enterobacter agglomerans TaxID=549 RepID=UPI000E21147E|nr:hypothetical protein [Pantoea agglomerans]MCH9408185.1 hypothetical protein [Pantoea agglomerans]NKE96784.1 hypothetical protein [Pantoea agglomerans]QTC52501.1 hypothetical protein H0Z11_20910 [Pantoea agglomerans]TRO71641.1 hypothetical protein E5140_18040 [Pantoea agglomerans]WNK33327.1 hypothetical protein RM157_23565 [Pantoea agglomerans]
MKNSGSDKEMDRKFRPFLKFWTLFSPEFIAHMQKITRLIRGEETELARLDQEGDMTAGYEACVSRWKAAHRHIALSIIVKLDDIKKLEADKKEHHRNRQKLLKDKCIASVELLKLEIRVLRRTADALIWGMLNNEHSSVRRLPISGDTDNLSRDSIIDSLIAADELNKDPHRLAVVSDMSTFVHVGDLVTFSLQHGFQLVEVKSGKKNLELYEAAEFAFTHGCPKFEKQFLDNMSPNDIQQFKRIKNQMIRAGNALEAIHTGEGYDNLMKTPVSIEERDYRPEFFNMNIVKLAEEVKAGKKWAIDIIDECVYIGVYPESDLGFIGFNTWIDGTEFKGRVTNINDSFFDPLSRPFLNLNLPTDLLMDIMAGKLLIVMCFDHEKFFERANAKHPGLFTLEEYPQKYAHTQNTLHVGSKGIASLVEGNVSFVGNGFETRILFDLQRPDNLIDWSYQRSDLKMKS